MMHMTYHVVDPAALTLPVTQPLDLTWLVNATLQEQIKR